MQAPAGSRAQWSLWQHVWFTLMNNATIHSSGIHHRTRDGSRNHAALAFFSVC
jgi:hypothetical protein